MRKFWLFTLKCALGALIGAIILCAFSAVQKLLVHYPIKPAGFYVPVIFGGLVGIIICKWRSRLKNKQYALSSAIKKSEESNRLKSEFLANLSHEVRTPLNSIIGFSQLITKENLDIKQRKQYCEIINSRTNDFLSIIENILLISEIETNQIDITNREFKLSKLVKEIKTYTELHELKISNKNEFKFTYPDHSENIILDTDFKILKQILHRLIHNAFKFTTNGIISIQIRINELTQLEFIIEDNGIGIAKKDHEVVFEKFRQIDGSLTRQYGGCGLGLSIARGLTNKIKGEFFLESELNNGTTIVIKTPIIVKSENNLKDSIIEKYSPSLKDKHILIVEDDLTSYLLIKEYLDSTEAKISHSESGEKSIQFCKEHKSLSLILMDIQLPGIDGLTAVKEIRKFNPKIPIIVQTAHTLSKDEDQAVLAGSNDFIAKPIDEKELIHKIKNQLSNFNFF